MASHGEAQGGGEAAAGRDGDDSVAAQVHSYVKRFAIPMRSSIYGAAYDAARERIYCTAYREAAVLSFACDGTPIGRMGRDGTPSELGTLHCPVGVNVDERSGEVVVASGDNHCVLVFDEHGELQKAIQPSAPHQFSRPWTALPVHLSGVALARVRARARLCGGGVVGADDAPAVWDLDADGEPLRQGGHRDDGVEWPADFDAVDGAVVPPDEDYFIIVSDRLTNKVRVFSRNGGGQPLFSIVHHQLFSPHGLTKLDDHSFLVASKGRQCVLRFTFDGVHVRMPDLGLSPRFSVKSLHCVGVDSQQNIIVADTGSNRVLVFDRSGRELLLEVHYNGRDFSPMSVCAGPADSILVASYGCHEAVLFEPWYALRGWAPQYHTRYPRPVRREIELLTTIASAEPDSPFGALPTELRFLIFAHLSVLWRLGAWSAVRPGRDDT